MNRDAHENRKSPESRREHALGKDHGISPKDVAGRIFGPNAEGASHGQGRQPHAIDRAEIARAEKEAIAASGLLPKLNFPGSIDARGTEHSVRFRGSRVEKHQHASGWMPIINPKGQVALTEASPTEYLRRLDLQNELFGDDIMVIGLTRGDRFAITQPTLKGGEPTEMEIREILEAAGWKRVPMKLQDLPPTLMGSAWWHEEEHVILLDARKPNLKKTDFGAILPIDFILADLTVDMSEILHSGSTL